MIIIIVVYSFKKRSLVRLFLAAQVVVSFIFSSLWAAPPTQSYLSMPEHEGSLYQICVPRALVDTIAYAAQRKGTPYRNPLIGYDFDSYKQRHLHLTPLLDAYCNNPYSIGPLTLDRLQGRLLFSQDILLNPKSGVKIFRYTTIPQEKQQKYQQKLHQLTQKLFKTWLKKVYAGTKKINIPLKFQDITELVEYYDISK